MRTVDVFGILPRRPRMAGWVDQPTPPPAPPAPPAPPPPQPPTPTPPAPHTPQNILACPIGSGYYELQYMDAPHTGMLVAEQPLSKEEAQRAAGQENIHWAEQGQCTPTGRVKPPAPTGAGGAAPTAGPSCPGVPEMPFQQWQDKILSEKQQWEAGGKKTLVGGPVKWSAPDGKTAISQVCYYPDGTSGEVPTNLDNGCPISCQSIYDRQKGGGTPVPVPPSTQPAAGGGPVPVSINIHAYTPSFMQRAGIPQPVPLVGAGGGRGVPPGPEDVIPEPPPTQAHWLPPEEKKSGLTELAIGGGIFAVGAAAIALFH